MEISDCVNFCDCQYNRIIVPCVLSASINCDSMELREDWLNYFMTKSIYILINPVFWIYPFKVLDQQQIEDKFR